MNTPPRELRDRTWASREIAAIAHALNSAQRDEVLAVLDEHAAWMIEAYARPPRGNAAQRRQSTSGNVLPAGGPVVPLVSLDAGTSG